MSQPTTIAGRLKATQTFIENVLASPDLLTDFARVNRGATYFEQGRTLHATAEAAQRQCAQERGEAKEALSDRDETLTGAAETYLYHLDLARLAFEDDEGAEETLDLDGRREQSIDEWAEQATGFYDNLLANDDYREKMAEYRIEEAHLVAARAAVAAVSAAHRAYLREKGESEEATVTRDKLLVALDRWHARGRKLARILYRNNRQRLEQLGIVVRA